MKVLAGLLVLVLGGVGCARIYRPVAVATSTLRTRGPQLAAHLERQPWGDNSRYEARAQKARLEVLALTLENGTQAQVDVLQVEVPSGISRLTPAEALALVRQWPLAYVPYVAVPVAAAAMSSGYEGLAYAALGVIGLLIAVPNAIVANLSNERLESFFQAEAWSPGTLHPGEVRVGLLFLRRPSPSPSLLLRIEHRVNGVVQHLEVPGP